MGTTLVHRTADGPRSVRIVETEAYRGPGDGACHARFGCTRRTQALFGPPGHAYVFLIYGMYDCFNVVCLAEGKGHAVLVRAAEPLDGWAAEDGREGLASSSPRLDGPGRLTRALGITRAEDGADLVTGGALQLFPREGGAPRVAVSPRVGVGYAGAVAEAPWRFFDARSHHVSRPSPRLVGLGRRPR